MKKLAVGLCFTITLFAATSINAAVYVVDKITDTNDGVCNADCSLREAIAAANATADNDVITFLIPAPFSAQQTITLTLGELVVANNGSLTIFGPGANRLTISGNNNSRILVSGANVVVNIHNLRFTGGNGVGTTNSGRGGAIYNVGGTMVITNSILTGNSAANGGALNNAASAGVVVPANLTLINCVISNNSSTSSGAAMQNFSTSFLNIRNSTISNNNTTSTGIAGAFQANGTVTITNSTFSGNTASGTGGAIYYNGGSLIMTNVTVTGNTSAVGSGGFHKATATLNANVRNSIFSGNTGAAGTGDALGPVSSQGNNIVQNVGTSTGWIASDITGSDPLLAAFGFYGGLGNTYLPLAASPAVNAGQNCVTDLTCSAANPPVAVTTDQRGAARPFNTTVDIGAVELSGDYYAQLPSAVAGVPYLFTLIPVNGPFMYTLVNPSSLGGITISTTSQTILNGRADVVGTYNGLIHVTGTPGQVFQNYRVHVLGDPLILFIAGQVVSNSGDPIRDALVVLTSLDGSQTILARTNAFGYYRMDGIPAGFNGTVTIASKTGLTFTPQPIAVTDVIDNFDLRAQP